MDESDLEVRDILAYDVGHIRIGDYCGGDLRSVNNARASYSAESEEYTGKDRKLVSFLGRNMHNTPLRGGLTVCLDVDNIPLPIAMQWYKHQVGTEYAFKDCPWSQSSARFKPHEAKFFTPVWRKQDKTNKQKSVELEKGSVFDIELSDAYAHCIRLCLQTYNDLLKQGISREQARFVLPGAFLTSFRWTASIQALVHFTTLRAAADAQHEIQKLARVVRSLVRPLGPDTWDALEAGHPVNLRGRIERLEQALTAYD